MKVHDPLAQAAFICSVGEKTRNHFWGNISRKIDSGGRRHPSGRLSAAQLEVLDIVSSAEVRRLHPWAINIKHLRFTPLPKALPKDMIIQGASIV